MAIELIQNATAEYENHPTGGQTYTLDWTRQVFGPIGIVGIIFNLLIVITVSKLEMNKGPSCLAIQLLAFWDSIAIIGDAIFEMTFKSILNFDIFVLDQFGVLCKVLRSFDWLGNHSANWHVVILCLDRYLSVAKPMFYYGQWKRRHIWILSVCSVVLTWISQLPFLYFFRKVNNTCDLDPGFFPAFVLRYFIKFQAYVMFFAVPGILIVSMSVAFIYKQTKKRPTEGRKLSAERIRTELAYRRMIIALIISYIFIASAASVAIYVGLSQGHIWAYNLGDGLLVTQSSLNLVFYMFSGPVFRNALWRAIICK